jgi:DNA-binding response OmpR family regulator
MRTLTGTHPNRKPADRSVDRPHGRPAALHSRADRRAPALARRAACPALIRQHAIGEDRPQRAPARVRRASLRSRDLGDVALPYDAQLGAFSLDGLPLRLTALEWRVLSCLMLRKEHVVARRDLLERVYDGDAEVDSNSVEVIVARLRRKVGHTLIQTVRGLGYRLTAEPP